MEPAAERYLDFPFLSDILLIFFCCCFYSQIDLYCGGSTRTTNPRYFLGAVAEATPLQLKGLQSLNVQLRKSSRGTVGKSGFS